MTSTHGRTATGDVTPVTTGRPRRARRAVVVALAAGALLAAGCGDADEPTDATGDEPAADGGEESAGGPTIRLRGQDFSESVTLHEVYGQFLEARGFDVEIDTAAGFRTEAIGDLEAGDLDLIIDYAGGSQTELAPDEETSSDIDEVIAAITPLYEDIGATVLEISPAIDGDAFVVRGDADAETISDVAELDFVFGASAQCFERPQCFLGYTDPDVYGIEFADTVTIEFGPLLGSALSNEEVDAVVWNTTAPQIEADGFKILEDDLDLHPAQNVVPVIRTEVLDAYGDDLSAAIDELSAAIATEDLIDWNIETDIENRESDDVASEWLEAEGLL
ncbi:MAG: glycine betaine ABC transporter substrate-binding protein [Acidimicrobiales bacterium]